ncbi:hypothetical protein [Streptomyces acidiscabies]|uniref:hypothetical protein n=1 Tax=Streptomyces acidiscabies TaxID=42234 RepID=UPI00073F682C|nr:hypothetical protein [Streptomyces acidiscabies]GAQ50595.1 hypothetical protein a10_00372 [Streptomyces acidiscabies]
MRLLRLLAGAAGLALLGFGASLLIDLPHATDVLLWLAAAVVLHDGLIAPLVLLAGRAGVVRGPVRAALIVSGALTAVALPVLLRPGPRPNSSVLPLDYPRNWLIALAVIALAAAVAHRVGKRLTNR